MDNFATYVAAIAAFYVPENIHVSDRVRKVLDCVERARNKEIKSGCRIYCEKEKKEMAADFCKEYFGTKHIRTCREYR